MNLLLGVDGGATKTLAVVGTLDGTLVGSAKAPPSNYHNVGIKKAVRAIRSAVLSACQHGGVAVTDLETVVMGLAAMDSPADFRVGREIADLTRLAKHRIVKHDSVIALYAATLGGPGIVVNAGTGSFAAGLDERGKAVRAGGRGNIIDDEGSAYDIGKLGIRAALRAFDRMERETAITRLLVRNLRLTTVEDIVHEIYQKPMTVEEISALSKLVAEAALKGDPVARDIFRHEGQSLAKLVSTVAERLDIRRKRPDIYLTGGVFKSGPTILDPFRREMRKNIPHFATRRPAFEPVIGAFVLALKEHNVVARGPILANLQASYDRERNRIK